jgi:hypothetical protein
LIDVLQGNADAARAVPMRDLLQAAERHGVLPHLTKRLPILPSFPPSSLPQVLELLAALKRLQAARVDVIALKGPALAVQLYGDATRRMSRDIDLLVTAAAFERAHDILVEHGYVPEFNWRGRHRHAFLERYHDLAFLSPAGGLIELHWRLVQSRYTVRYDLEAMWQNSVTVDVLGQAVRVFCPNDLLFYLALHGAKHQWSQLDLVLDVAALLKDEHLDLQAVVQSAAAAHTNRLLRLAIALAESIDPVLQERRWAAPDAAIVRLTRQIMRKWDEPRPAGPLDTAWFDLRVRERWRDRLRIAASTAFAPGLPDWRALPLPDALFPLYPVVRPFRLLASRIGQARKVFEQSARHDG